MATYRTESGGWALAVQRGAPDRLVSLFIAANLAAWALREHVIDPSSESSAELAPWIVLPRPALEQALRDGLTAAEIADEFVTFEGVVMQQVATMSRRTTSGLYRAFR